jgi:hypothetical protein
VGTGVAEALDVGHLGALFEGLAFGGHDWKKGAHTGAGCAGCKADGWTDQAGQLTSKRGQLGRRG